jgi:hypothetical protein
MDQQTQDETITGDFTATYSPEDNKLRLYAAHRLDDDLYQRVKAARFRWAPKQDLFFTHWSPKAEDLLFELCGSIGDEDTTLVERSEQRAERFEDYSDNRAQDADNAHKAVKSIADNIPFGQPILVGHHSEKRARKDAERIQNGMRKTVKLWETAEYWTYRAQGVIRSAKYKERTDVRARRIKKLEAENRKYNKYIKDAETLIKLWSSEKLDYEKAVHICNYLDHLSMCFPSDKYPRSDDASQYEGDMSLWSAITGKVITFEQARDLSIPSKHRTINWYTRWVAHNDNRLTYEMAMLEAQGGSDLLKPKARPKQLPMLNYRAPEGIRVDNLYHKGEYSIYDQVEMTKAEYAAIRKDYKGGQKIGGTHRVKVAMNAFINGKSGHGYSAVFLTDSKEHAKPEVK